MVKSLDTPYTAGRRGAGWIKVKPRHTLDLVVLAVEWGHGRRKGWLSNLHLGARDPETGGFVMLGKTFKGLTDKMLAWQTERLPELAVADRPVDGLGPARTGGRDRLRRGAAQLPLPGRDGAAVRPGPALPPRQAAGGRHRRHRPLHPRRHATAGPGRDALSRSRTGPHLDTVRGRCDPAGWARRGSEHRDHR